MIPLESNFWNYLFHTHPILEFGGLLLILGRFSPILDELHNEI